MPKKLRWKRPLSVCQKIASIRLAPQYIADELLRAEGFTDIRYVETDSGRRPPARSLAASSTSLRTSRHP